MSRLYPLGLLLAAAFTLVSCDLWDHSGESADDLLPLAVGNEWILSFERTSVDSDAVEVGRDTLRVAASQTVEGEAWFELENSGTHAFAPVLEGLYTNREDGVWKRQDAESDPYLLYAYPTEEDATYALPGEANTEVVVLDTEAEVDTPAGTFKAHLYAFDSDEPFGFPVEDGAARFLRHLVPGQGFARAECTFLRPSDAGVLTASMEITWRLESFED